MTRSARLVPLADALGDHSSEGISILTAEPWRVLHALIYTMIALVLKTVACERASWHHTDTSQELVPTCDTRL